MSCNNSSGSRPTNKCTQMMAISDNKISSNSSTSDPECNLSLPANSKKDLQSLLLLSTSLHSPETNANPNEMDEERKQFLKEVFASLTVDPADEMKKMIAILNETVEGPKQGRPADVEHCLSTLDKLCDFVCSIDLANLFYYLEGLESLMPLLDHEEPNLRSMAASVVAECCQNNPFCQKLSTRASLFRSLIQNANDLNNSVRFKALSALSAIIRNNPEGVNQFRKYNGFSMIANALNSQNERIVRRASFFITALCDTDESTKDDLVEVGTVPVLVNLTKMSDEEYCLQALLSLMTKHESSIKECIKEGFHLYIEQVLSDENTKEALKEKKTYCLQAQKFMEPFIAK